MCQTYLGRTAWTDPAPVWNHGLAARALRPVRPRILQMINSYSHSLTGYEFLIFFLPCSLLNSQPQIQHFVPLDCT